MDKMDSAEKRPSSVEIYGSNVLKYLDRVIDGDGSRFYGTFAEFAASLVRLGTPETLFNDVMVFVKGKASKRGLDKRYHELPENTERPVGTEPNEGDWFSNSFGHVHQMIENHVHYPPKGSVLGIFINLGAFGDQEE